MPEKTWIKNLSRKKIEEIKNDLIKEINQNELMRKKHKKVCRVSSYNLLTVISTIAKWVSISAFASLADIPIEIISSAIQSESFVITGAIKGKHDKIVL